MRKDRYGDYEGKIVQHPKRIKYACQTVLVDCDGMLSKSELRPFRDALKPGGRLRWNPDVAGPDFNMVTDEWVPAGTRAEESNFENDAKEFGWMSEDEEEGGTDEDSEGETDGEAQAPNCVD